MEILSCFSKRSDESRQIGPETQAGVHVESCSFGPLRKIEQEITTLVRLLFAQRTESLIVEAVIIVLCNQHLWLHTSYVLANCFELMVWCVTEVQEADSAFVGQVVCVVAGRICIVV